MNKPKSFPTFENNEKAVAYLEAIRWKNGVVCPYCNSKKTCKHTERHRYRQRYRWQCWNCDKSFSVTVGTMFHHTHMPLKIWFDLIAHMMDPSKEKISTHRVARELGINPHVAGSMMHRIRKAMRTDQMDLLKSIFINKYKFKDDE